MGNTRILIAMPATEVTTCPSCRAPMGTHRFMRKPLGEVELDRRFSCQGTWFDDRKCGQGRGERGSVHHADIGDLLLDGVAMVRNMVQR